MESKEKSMTFVMFKKIFLKESGIKLDEGLNES
jgi:hypothetical protein